MAGKYTGRPAAARAYLARYGPPGAKPASQYTDAYAVRVANGLANGQTRQQARRGPAFFARARAEQAEAASRGRKIQGGLERPRGRHVGPPDEGFTARQYRRFGPARRLVGRVLGDGWQNVSILGFGTLTEGYSGIADVNRRKGAWRVLFTGDGLVALSAWDDIAEGWAVDPSGNARERLFEELKLLDVRWGPHYG